MSSTTLLDRIKADADAAVTAIQEEAAAEVAAIKADCTEKLTAVQAEAAARLEKAQAQQSLVATSKAKQEGKLMVQQAKRTNLDRLFAAVYDELRTLPAAEYVAFFSAHVARLLPATVSITQVVAPTDREAETKEILSQYALGDSLSSDASLLAGMLVTTTDGVYDISLERICADARPSLEMGIATEFLRA